jgi:pimeloyl-ACP methyl ester carboxylesterase
MRPVVLVHGFGSSYAHGWVENAWPDILADSDFEAVGVDMLGHGDAPKPHDPAAYERGLVESVEAVLPSDPVDAIGFSMGAATLLRIAVEDASRFHRLVLIGIGAHTIGASTGGGTQTISATDDRVLTQLADSDRNDPEALDALRRRPQQPFTDEQLARVTVPTLVITSDADGLAGAPQPLVDKLPNVQLKLLRGIDHFQTPREFATIDAAVEFLSAG